MNRSTSLCAVGGGVLAVQKPRRAVLRLRQPRCREQAERTIITNAHTGTRIDEICDGSFRIHTAVKDVPDGFSFNQYLAVTDALADALGST